MTTSYPKRLIEVDLPIKRISAHARREKSIRHGHISTLHIWWARRPLAACRAVICAALWPDPADELCPQPFRNAVARLLPAFAEQVRRSEKLANLCSPESFQRWQRTNEHAWKADHAGSWYDMREALLDFIADFANWDASTVPTYLETARGLTQAAHEALGGLPGTRPLVVDPFAGGGAIPLEALRVGADAFASDLNPVAVLLNKVVLEYIPKYGNAELRMMNAEGEKVVFHGLAEAVRYWGNWIKEQAERELAEFYPKDPDGATPIAYLWARTIICEGPGCGTEIPLIKSLWLAHRGDESVALGLITDERTKRVSFQIIHRIKSADVREGTIQRGAATCPVCGYTTPIESVRRQLKARRGGAADARLYCLVTAQQGRQGRSYRLPTDRDVLAARSAARELQQQNHEHHESIALVPNEATPLGGGNGAGRAFSQRNYGMDQWSDLFTPRQLLALTTLTAQIRYFADNVPGTENEIVTAVQTCLALNLNRVADRSSSLCTYDPNPTASGINHTFARPAIPIVWDFGEGDPTSERSGGWQQSIGWLLSVIEYESRNLRWAATVEQGSATSLQLPDDVAQAFVTDPPYYDAVPYADLSDFFYVWLKRALSTDQSGLFASELVPKGEECIVDEVKGKDKRYFESSMRQALAEGRRILTPSGIGIIVFAHKSTSGWEAQLQAMIEAGWTVTGSWPVDTEMGTRLRAKDSAALASSIHLVCRPRENADGALQTNLVGDWREVLQELPTRIHAWLPRLAHEGIVGADAIFACLGPALEIFSRYSRVERASGEVMTLSTYLEYVWGAVSKEALDMVFAGADTTGFEEDARLTAMWLWTLGGDGDGADEGKVVASTGYTLEYDAARKIAQGLGAHLEQLGHLVEVKGSNARLLPAVERTRHLFGIEGVKQPGRRGKREQQMSLFEGMPKVEAEAAGWTMDDDVVVPPGRTVLDRVHQSMLLFAAGRSNALKRYLVDEGIGKDERYWRLAQALSALYPSHTDEKRWVDGVLARKKGLGF